MALDVVLFQVFFWVFFLFLPSLHTKEATATQNFKDAREAIPHRQAPFLSGAECCAEPLRPNTTMLCRRVGRRPRLLMKTRGFLHLIMLNYQTLQTQTHLTDSFTLTDSKYNILYIFCRYHNVDRKSVV